MIKDLEKDYFTINQKGFTMYLMKITVQELVSRTYVEYYDHINEKGYQRKLIPKHYRRIARFLLESENSVMPSSIICAIDKKDVVINKEKIIFKDKLRVVDGQHRREAFSYYFSHYLKSKDSKFADYELPLIVLIINDDNDRLIEIETFVNINSKAKPVKTDLAVELRENMRIKRNPTFDIKTEFVESVATSVAKVCNDMKDCVWENKIRMAEEVVQKPVGINAFKKALIPVINSYIELNELNYESIQRNDQEFNNVVNEISTIYCSAWKVVYKKWPMAFENYKDFNLMKSVGINSINIVLSNCIRTEGSFRIGKFTNLISNSKESISIWQRGGELSGLSSEQGFKTISDRLMKNTL
jgi:DGQHR domain-containing protein